MALVFRLTEDQMMRSVDDLPGVVGVSYLESGATFTVDARWLPSRQLQASGAAMLAAGRGGVMTEQREVGDPGVDPIPVSIDEAVAGCESTAELAALIQFVRALVFECVEKYAAAYGFHHVEAVSRWAVGARDAIAVRLEAEVDDA